MEAMEGIQEDPGNSTLSISSCLEGYIVFDVETTGLDVETNRVIQLAMIKVKTNGEVEKWCKYFNPCLPREKQLEAYKIHGISPETLEEREEFKSSYCEIIEFINGVRYLVGHNVLFDWDFLQKELHGAEGGNHAHLNDIVLIDTLKISISSFPELSKFRLQDLATYLRFPETSFHDALADSMVTRKLLIACFDKLETSNGGNVVSIRSLETSYPQFTYPVRSIYLTDRLRNGTLNLVEKQSLLEFAKTFMSAMPTSRGKLLKDMPKESLRSAIRYISSRQRSYNISNARNKVLMELVLTM